LQTDARSAYETVVAKSAGRIIPVGCWAHTRRNSFDARPSQPREVHHVLGLIAQLHDIEGMLRLKDPDERLSVRQEQSVPILNRIKIYFCAKKKPALPRSQYGQAIAYALNHWDELRRFTEDGRLEIDNNTVERTLRPRAISRKNGFLVGSDRGGEAAAICFSILAGANRHRIEPLAYVIALLTALSSTEVDLEPLLPDAWIKAHPVHFPTSRRSPRGDPPDAAARWPPVALCFRDRPWISCGWHGCP
jgi:hypothetical protein